MKKVIGHQTAQSVGKAALVVSFFGIISRILGLVRDRLLASTFGAGDVSDAYLTAFRVPDTLFELLVLGALGVAFIPVFTGLVSRGEEDRAWRCAYGVLTLLVVVLGGLSLILFFLAPFIIHIIAPGFTKDVSELSIAFTRIMLWSPVFLGISAVFGGVLISFQRFVLYALAPIFYNIGIIVGITVFTPIMGSLGIAWGVVFGALLHMAIHAPAFHNTGHFFLGGMKDLFANKDIRKILRLMLPRMFATSSNLLSLTIVTFFASTLVTGSITAFTFANNIQSVVIGLVGVPFALAVFPLLSAQHAKAETAQFGDLFATTLRRILFYVVPASAVLFILREQAVRVIYGGGKFDWEDTVMTFSILGILTLSLFAQSLIPLLARTFYAMHNTKTPLYAALLGQACNVGVVVALIEPLGIAALAWGFSIAAIVNMLLLGNVLVKQIGQYVDYGALRDVATRIGIATVIASAAAVISRELFTQVLTNTDRFIEIFAQLVVSGSVGIGVYLCVAYVLHIEECHTLRQKLLVRIFGRPSVAAEEQK